MSTFRVLVCVTRQKTCEKLIHEGVELAKKHDGEVSVVHVAENGADFLGIHKEAEAIEYLYGVCRAAHADMTVLRADHVLDTLVQFIRDEQVQVVVTGVSPGKSGVDFAQNLRLRLPGTQVYTVVTQES